MSKIHGVGLGILALGLVGLGAPASRAQGRLAAGGAGSGIEPATTSASSTASTPVASSPADLDHRIDALETELAELRAELSAKKDAEAASAAAPAITAAPQDKPADAAKGPEKVTVASLLGPTSLSGFVDVYYNYNSNHPAGNDVTLCAFNCTSKSIGLNMIELILDKAPDPMGGVMGRTGYHVALGYGEAEAVINGAESTASAALGYGGGLKNAQGFDQYVKEAYFSYLAPVGSGLQIDVGKFVTPLGAEVIESKDNWNYSRGLLFNYAIPFNHFGARAKYTFNSKVALTGFFVNGFNNVVDNNSGKTYGVSAGLTPTKKTTLTLNYLAGPEESAAYWAGSGFNANNFWRQTWDLVYVYNLTSKLSFMANYDYVHGDRFITNFSTNPVGISAPVYYTGGAGYLKYAPNDKNYVAARYEYFYDRYGYALPLGIPHDHAQEFTFTYQRTIATHLLTRLEYRRDMAGQPLFPISDFSNGVKNQNLFTVGMIFLFDSRDAK